MNRLFVILLALFSASTAFATPSSKVLLKKYIEAKEKGSGSVLTMKFEKGEIGVLPATFKWFIEVSTTIFDARGRNKVWSQREMSVDFELKVFQIIDSANMIVSIVSPGEGAPPKNTPLIDLWIEGISTDSLSDGNILDNLHPLLFNKIFYVSTKRYKTRMSQRTVKKLIVSNVKSDYDAYRKEVRDAAKEISKRKKKAISKLNKKYKKIKKESREKIKQKYLKENKKK